MTYAQLRRHLSEIAAYGDVGAPHTRFAPARWMTLQCAGVVAPCGRYWIVTARGWAVLASSTMPGERPRGRPSRHARRRTPAIGHGPHHQLHPHHDVRKLA
jgi:hypothetical protein